MKIRIGYGLGTRSRTNDPDRFGALVDALERERFDSLWLSERIGGDCPDPVVGMAFACGRTTRLKVGMSVMVLPGRNPVVLAKTLASLDRLSNGRLLPAFGLGVADSAEHQAFGVQRKERGAWFNEALPLMRRLWSEDDVDHHGPRFDLEAVTVRPRPAQDPLEVWLGGIAPLELKRVGRHADGWLPSFCTAPQVAEARVVVERVAAEHDRTIDPEHFGALIAYRTDDRPVPERTAELAKIRNPDADVNEIIPTRADLPAAIGRFVDVGFSKFVLIPTNEPDDWDVELADVAARVRPLET
ncbi:MAG: LLM class flavin-dependent oxidoreductase [Acidimicrobiales bacterium]